MATFFCFLAIISMFLCFFGAMHQIAGCVPAPAEPVAKCPMSGVYTPGVPPDSVAGPGSGYKDPFTHDSAKEIFDINLDKEKLYYDVEGPHIYLRPVLCAARDSWGYPTFVLCFASAFRILGG